MYIVGATYHIIRQDVDDTSFSVWIAHPCIDQMIRNP